MVLFQMSFGSCIFCVIYIAILFYFFSDSKHINYFLTLCNMESTDSCSVGKALEDECHKLTYTRIKQLLNFNTIKEEKILLKWSSSLWHLDALEAVCMHHYKSFIGNAFEKKYSKCCDIFQKHAKKSKQTIT